jgi:outer membrane protease
VGFLQKETDTFHLHLGASLNVEYGDMTYTIQGPEDGGWKSVLEWPLENIVYLGGLGSFSFSRKFQVNVGFWKSITEEAGTMKDSDWLYGYYGNRKAVYSETDTTVDSTQFDINFRYDFFQRESFSLGGILGYAYTKWDWTAGNGYQWTIDPNNFYQGAIEGIGITYVQKVKVPYLGLALSLSSASSAFGFNVYTLYSPIAKCDDEDDHILRSKLSQGQTDGTFLSIGGDLRWSFTYHWSLTGTLNYSAYDLTGDQVQYFYAGENAGSGATGIDMTVEGSQVYLGLRVGYEL